MADLVGLWRRDPSFIEAALHRVVLRHVFTVDSFASLLSAELCESVPLVKRFMERAHRRIDYYGENADATVVYDAPGPDTTHYLFRMRRKCGGIIGYLWHMFDAQPRRWLMEFVEVRSGA